MARDFKGIWIPKEIWLAEDLTLMEKLFLVEINSLDNEDGCWANNEYFSKFFDLSHVRVSQIINSLIIKGYLTSQIKVNEGNKRILKTLLNFSLRPSQTKVNDPHKEKLIHNNTINNTENNTPIPVPDFDLKFKEAFDELTMKSYERTFRGVDLKLELIQFKLKCDNDKGSYYHRDSAGLRNAFQYQLKNIRKPFEPVKTVEVYKRGRRLGEDQ